MVESPAFRGAFENPCELLVSPTFGSLFRRFGFVEMIENLWELVHLPNSASRWRAMRFEGSPTGDSFSESSNHIKSQFLRVVTSQVSIQIKSLRVFVV